MQSGLRNAEKALNPCEAYLTTKSCFASASPTRTPDYHRQRGRRLGQRQGEETFYIYVRAFGEITPNDEDVPDIDLVETVL